jgi:hypothetical protein
MELSDKDYKKQLVDIELSELDDFRCQSTRNGKMPDSPSFRVILVTSGSESQPASDVGDAILYYYWVHRP